MRKVIVNSTPLIVLSGVGELNLLKKLYREVSIPEAVYREVTAKKDSVCMQVIGESDWIHIEKIRDRSEKKMYKAKLHDGEVEVMILAQEKQADLVVIDDNAAKKTAMEGQYSWKRTAATDHPICAEKTGVARAI